MPRHLRAIAALPLQATVTVPVVLQAGHPIDLSPARTAVALPLLATGLGLFVATNLRFGREGDGTLAPWDPPRKLVVTGPYRYVRNPMITGVACVLLGEATLLGSRRILIWFAAFVAVNAIYLPIIEEPRLVRRFGSDYERYRETAGRFLPRLRGRSGRRQRD